MRVVCLQELARFAIKPANKKRRKKEMGLALSHALHKCPFIFMLNVHEYTYMHKPNSLHSPLMVHVSDP